MATLAPSTIVMRSADAPTHPYFAATAILAPLICAIQLPAVSSILQSRHPLRYLSLRQLHARAQAQSHSSQTVDRARRSVGIAIVAADLSSGQTRRSPLAHLR